MKTLIRCCALFAAVFAVISFCISADIRSAGPALGHSIKSNWSKDSTWEGRVIPGPGDNVTVSDGDTVYIDFTTEVNDITVGDGVSGALIFTSAKEVDLTVTGNLLVKTGATFRNTGGATAELLDTLYIYGNFTYNGTNLSFRAGSAPNYGCCCIYFMGFGNSNFKAPPTYNPKLNVFNAITVNKTGTGKVTLLSDICMAGGSSVQLESQPYLDLLHGVIDTRSYAIIIQSTAGGADIITHASKNSYIMGCLGRGMSSGSTATRWFPVGDKDGYRPIRVRSATSGNATGHFLRVRAIRGNANPFNDTLPAAINKIATVRYYKLTYDIDTSQAYPSMAFDRFFPSYGAQDGVAPGNTHLRIAYTTDSLIHWRAMSQALHPDTTKIGDTVSYWNADSLPRYANADGNFWMTLQAKGASGFVALARAAGTTENSLEFNGTARYTIFPSAGPHGAIVPSDTMTFDSGATQSYTFRPDADYHVAGVLVDSLPVDSLSGYTFYNITANHAIRVTFASNNLLDSVSAGWNMLSVPLAGAPRQASTLFPTAISPAFAFVQNYGYQTRELLTAGIGYWVKFDSAGWIALPVDTLFLDTIDLVEGWNLVGSLSAPIPVTAVSISTEGLTLSDFWGFTTTYVRVAVIEPGKGYWVKASGNGRVVLKIAK